MWSSSLPLQSMRRDRQIQKMSWPVEGLTLALERLVSAFWLRGSLAQAAWASSMGLVFEGHEWWRVSSTDIGPLELLVAFVSRSVGCVCCMSACVSKGFYKSWAIFRLNRRSAGWTPIQYFLNGFVTQSHFICPITSYFFALAHRTDVLMCQYYDDMILMTVLQSSLPSPYFCQAWI